MTEWTKMTLRLPVQVHTALAEDARKRDKSLNQVIVDRLNRSLGGVYVSEEEANDGSILQRLEALESWVKQQDLTFRRVDDAAEEEPDAGPMTMIAHGKIMLTGKD